MFSRTITYELTENEKKTLTLDEKHLIKDFMLMKSRNTISSIIIKISIKYHLDFIDWDNTKEVYVCKNKITSK